MNHSLKKLLLLVALCSFSAQAADDFICFLDVSRDGRAIGSISISQAYGTTAGHLYTLPVSVKKNVFGKTVKSVEISMDGRIDNSGTDGSSVDASLTLVTTTDRGFVVGKSHSVEKLSLAKIEGRDDVSVDQNSPSGYSVKGTCRVYPGE